MKKKYLAAIFVILIFSCKKENVTLYQNLVGKWDWKISYDIYGGKMIPTLPSKSIITFNLNKTFINKSVCIIGNSLDGQYEIKNTENADIIILKSQNYMPDTFKIEINGSHLLLTATPKNYSWKNEFSKIE